MDTYKEKYEAALQLARSYYDENTNSFLDTIFPELAESEDKRITRAINNMLPFIPDEAYANNGVTKEDVLAWLEKQKDASKAIEVVDKIDKYIDKYAANAHDMKDSNPDKKYYLGWDGALGKIAGILQDVYSGEKRKEQKPERINITEMVAKYKATDEYVDGDYVGKPVNCMIRAYEQGIRDTLLKVKEQKPVKGDNETEIQKAFREGKSAGRKEVFDHPEEYGLQKPAEWNEEDEKMLDKAIELTTESGWDRDKEKCLSWLKSLRPSWKPSEQEKSALRTAIYVLTDERSFPKTAAQLQNILDVFKGEESRKDWNPSEEQMEALKTAMDRNDSIGYNLGQLYEQLKKLM